MEVPIINITVAGPVAELQNKPNEVPEKITKSPAAAEGSPEVVAQKHQ